MLSFPEPDALSNCLLGVGSALLGLVGLLGGFAHLARCSLWYPIGPLLMVTALAGTAAAAGLRHCIWLPTLGLAALWAFSALVLPLLVQAAGQLARSLDRDPRL